MRGKSEPDREGETRNCGDSTFLVEGLKIDSTAKEGLSNEITSGKLSMA
ncbi:MAG: hypothetical protein P1U85_05340 [Verrucomicrobiales bacterium]|nr:hypothetical protein [Verrucomicrobiales bacterium]